MKVSDYIVEFLINIGVEHVFGYPGGMVTHLMDSFSKYDNRIKAHVCYHEQAASFAACGYAQNGGTIGVAYATSGPGATNLITGICNAYFDSIPTLFITGQVNTFEAKGKSRLRQRGFQETNIVEMVDGVTKYAQYVGSPEQIRYCLEKAYDYAVSGRPGPVLLDIPMDIQKADVDVGGLLGYNKPDINLTYREYREIIQLLNRAQRPCIVLGAGVKRVDRQKLERFTMHMGIPVVTSMLAVDSLASKNPYKYGFIGAYGNREANFIVAKSDLLLVLGSRLDIRQVGRHRSEFAPNAKVIRVDIDPGELEYRIREDDIGILANTETVIDYLLKAYIPNREQVKHWNDICKYITFRLKDIDRTSYNKIVERISDLYMDFLSVTADVGQNQVWVAQSFSVRENQRILFSGGHGAMGYSLPASIGAYYATKSPVLCFAGDGGIQMNVQELEFVKRESIPIKIILLNNYSLGMIRHFQEMYFEQNYTQTVDGEGYSVPDFKKIAASYDIPYFCIRSISEIDKLFLDYTGAALIEVKISENTYVLPKLEYGNPNQDQAPLIDRALYEELMKL